ncbi:protein-disulfide reductase DsbD family protein [Paucibacter sp. Y2R2-4]|uniref:protein-disulfide reductase DsbD family protein n=1 Tax=Paucibacter sp. Y2R2-4 TaxID=2893553 RepID=UPI0021E4629D|nr:protein-disulfide reductase DsbD domain-containing protein [Paucibacter sp. Y2R2-4]MCV2348297.1 thioredoxin family protein [Paucibacter sp. Y2R2-4]
MGFGLGVGVGFSFRRLLAMIGVLLVASGLQAVSAAPPPAAGSEEVQLRLLSSHRVLQPGQTVHLLLRQTIAPHWHTYWLNPGDSGQATRIEWRLPEGVQASELQWPAPQRFSLGPVSNYGYADQVDLITEIRLPANWPQNRALQLQAQVSWLVCKDICLPQEAELSIALPVQARAQADAEGQAALTLAQARLPKTAPWPLSLHSEGSQLLLRWPVQEASGKDAPQAEFFAEQWGPLQHNAPQELRRQSQQWQLKLTPGEAPLKAAQPLRGVLVLTQAGARQAYQIEVPLASAPLPSRASATSAPLDLGLPLALLLALAGGLILNLMPCVFPVLSIKALSLLGQAHGDPAQARRHGMAYSAGVLLSFALLAAVLIGLRAAGAEVGWGFQFQSPLFVLGVAWLLFGLGLSLSGLLELGGGIAGLGQELAAKEGYAGSFFSGVLAAVVATPCTAPFMGAAMAYALSQSAPVLLAVLLSLGLGLALPYLVLSNWPALQARLPSPGAWMERLKQGFAFPMYGAAIWLVWVLAQQGGPSAVLLSLSGMALLALAAWLHRIAREIRPGKGRRLTQLATVLSLGVVVGLAFLQSSALPEGSGSPSSLAQQTPQTPQATFEPYTPERLSELRAQGKPVFVNLTAAWCISCLVNEKVALSQASVHQAFAREGVVYLKGDWTRKDPRISALLAEHGRSGVPLYLFYPAGLSSSPQVLPQLLTPGLVLQALEDAKKGAPPAKPSAGEA